MQYALIYSYTSIHSYSSFYTLYMYLLIYSHDSVTSTVPKNSNDSITSTVIRPFSKDLKIIRPVLTIKTLEYPPIDKFFDLYYIKHRSGSTT